MDKREIKVKITTFRHKDKFNVSGYFLINKQKFSFWACIIYRDFNHGRQEGDYIWIHIYKGLHKLYTPWIYEQEISIKHIEKDAFKRKEMVMDLVNTFIKHIKIKKVK